MTTRTTTSHKSLTHDPLLINASAPPRLLRVDTSRMTAPFHLNSGRTDEPAQHPADDNQGRGLDHLHRGHTLSDRMRSAILAKQHENSEPNEIDGERDPVALRWFVAGYCMFISSFLVAIAYADDIHHWLTH